MQKFYIIDGYLLLHRACYAPIGTTLTSPSGEPTTGTYIFTTSLLKLIREQKPDLLVVAMEGRTRTFRDVLYNVYKANRSCPTDDFVVQRNRIEQILTAMNIPILRVDGYEADDIIGTVAKQAQKDDFEVFVCSTDKDMFQLLDSSISMFDVKTGKYTYSKDVVEKFGVTPSQFVDFLALQGDPTDNVPGIVGVGSKTAAKWMSKYGSIENLLNHVDEIKGKLKDAILEFKDILPLNKKLVTIDCNVPIEINYDNFALKEFNKDKLREVFVELEFNRLITQLKL